MEDGRRWRPGPGPRDRLRVLVRALLTASSVLGAAFAGQPLAPGPPEPGAGEDIHDYEDKGSGGK
ncbi:hypothetical protein [Amycolatopsis circi]|uniref:hypothetical protein n=1 Tax=Amycolatopsis circi TaxID=871959 RepID=UPI000E27D943|nr:hypothetical protein [Amycolatopsis circi]